MSGPKPSNGSPGRVGFFRFDKRNFPIIQRKFPFNFLGNCPRN
jgi:hypothetical protein